jgi:hypothetical protein
MIFREKIIRFKLKSLQKSSKTSDFSISRDASEAHRTARL